MNEYTVEDMMVAYAEDGVDYARENFAIALDYSEESVQVVEELLGRLQEAIPKGVIAKLLNKSPSDETIEQLSKMLGGYIGEVIRRSFGGIWKDETEAFPGLQIVTLEIQGEDLWPHFKVGKRIVNGPEENVWHYFEVLRLKYGKL